MLLSFIILLRLLSVVLYLLTQFHSCHSNIAVYAPAISITTAAAAAAAATTAFILLLPAENAGCQMLLLERLCLLQHDGAFSAAALQCCYCYCFERWAFWPFGAAAAPSVALLVKRLCCRLHATAPVYLIRLLLRAASPEKQFNRDN